MNLRYLVPALGLLAATSTSAFAETVGGLTIGGFVDTGLTSSSNEGDHAGDHELGFWSNVELRFNYGIGEEVNSVIDIEFNNDSAASDTDGDGFLDTNNRDVYLEQAFVTWQLNEMLALTSGKFTTFSGWVSADADGLYRVNSGPISDGAAAIMPGYAGNTVMGGYGGELLGFALNATPNDMFAVTLFIVNGLDWATDTSSSNESDNGKLAVAVDVVITLADIGFINIEGGIDFLGEGDGPDLREATHTTYGINATINPESHKALTIGAEVLFNMVDDPEDEVLAVSLDSEASWMGALLMVNHKIPGPESVPMSGTVMFQYVSEVVADDVDDIFDQTVMEIALALLTNPTGDANFGVNLEFAYEIQSDNLSGSSVDDVTTMTGSLELIALIP